MEKGIPQTITIGNASFEKGQATSQGTKKEVTITSVDAAKYQAQVTISINSRKQQETVLV